jgi:hypothetical protein
MSLDQRVGRGWSRPLGVALSRAFPPRWLVSVGRQLFAMVGVWLSSGCQDFTRDTWTALVSLEDGQIGFEEDAQRARRSIEVSLTERHLGARRLRDLLLHDASREERVGCPLREVMTMTGLRASGAIVSTYWSELVTVRMAHTEITDTGINSDASTTSTHAEMWLGQVPAAPLLGLHSRPGVTAAGRSGASPEFTSFIFRAHFLRLTVSFAI